MAEDEIYISNISSDSEDENVDDEAFKALIKEWMITLQVPIVIRTNCWQY